MDDIHKRISRVREHFNLTQDEFGKRIGITRSSISGLESGRRDPSEQTISFICKEFGVNKSWLGNGGSDNNMFIQTPNSALEALQQEYDMTDFDILVVKTFAEMSPEQRKILSEFARKLAKEEKERQDLHDDLDKEIDNQKKVEEKFIGSDSTSA